MGSFQGFPTYFRIFTRLESEHMLNEHTEFMYKSLNLKMKVGSKKENSIKWNVYMYLNFKYYIKMSCSSWGFLSLWWPPWCAGSRLPPRERDRRRRALRWGWNVDCGEPRLVQLNALTFDMQWFICRLLRLTSISSLPKSPLSWIQATYIQDHPDGTFLSYYSPIGYK